MVNHPKRGRCDVTLGDGWQHYWGDTPLPLQTRALGIVAQGGRVGALIYSKAGDQYAMGISDQLYGLDQDKITAAIIVARAGARGGPGRGGGRRTADRVDVMKKTVTLDRGTIEWLRALGGGELSLGIRRAADALRAREAISPTADQ